MIVKYTEEEFNKAKSDERLALECECCGKIFYQLKKLIKHELTHKRGRCKYCSTECNSLTNNNHHIVHCEQCGKEIKVINSVYRNSKTKHFFCSNSCSASYNNTRRGPVSEETKKKISETLIKKYESEYNFDKKYHKKYHKKHHKKHHIKPLKRNNNSKYKKRVCKVCGRIYTLIENDSTKTFCSRKCIEEYHANRKKYLSKDAIEKLKQGGRKSAKVQGDNRRSKNEKYFCELCEKHFKNVKHNEIIFNGWDADVIIENVKYAILWNGKWHYEQIKKRHSVKQVQNRDRIKIQEIKKCGYTPYVIKDMGKYNPQFVEEQFEIFLKQLK